MSNANVKRRRLAAATALCCAFVAVWLGYRAVHRIRLRRPLIAAVKRNDLAAVRSLLDAGADPNARDAPAPSFAWTEMWKAITHPHDSPGSTAAPALQLAAIRQENEIAYLLVEHGADVNATSSYWPTFNGNGIVLIPSEMFRIPGPEPSAPPPGYTALMAACANGDAELARLLLDAGADPNRHPENENPPVVLALTGTIFDITDAGIATQSGTRDLIVRMLLAHGASVSGQAAVSAAMNDCWPCVLPLLEHGADVNTRSDDPIGRTLSIEAAAENDAATILFLAEHHADMNAPDKRNRTALMALCHRYTGELSIEALRTLLEHSANPNAQDNQGITALMEAAGVGKKDSFTFGPNLEAIQLLLKHGADPRIVDKSYKTVLLKLSPADRLDVYGQKARIMLEVWVAMRERGSR
jgi:ankyrin repeat protein